ncbi:NADPH-dependent F420 reductase [Pseudomonas sp. BP11-1-1]|uniref:NADPH-dependent F420 reductase n=1 Tax=Pseudomonas sp. BP11-1-1 TaxID=3064903 RepID=UPI003F97B4D5
MSYAIIGFGKIGQALAKAFARSGRDRPGAHSQTAGGGGQRGRPFFGCSLRVAPGCCEGAAELGGQDDHRCDQCLWRIPGRTRGLPSSKVVEQAFTGARLVKGFNHLIASVLEQEPTVQGGRRVVFLASDDERAAEEVGALAENFGFAPIRLGGLSEGGMLVQARGNSWGKLIFKDLIKFD